MGEVLSECRSTVAGNNLREDWISRCERGPRVLSVYLPLRDKPVGFDFRSKRATMNWRHGILIVDAGLDSEAIIIPTSVHAIADAAGRRTSRIYRVKPLCQALTSREWALFNSYARNRKDNSLAFRPYEEV